MAFLEGMFLALNLLLVRSDGTQKTFLREKQTFSTHPSREHFLCVLPSRANPTHSIDYASLFTLAFRI